MRSGVELFDSCEEISEWSSVCVMSGVDSIQACVCHACVSNSDRTGISWMDPCVIEASILYLLLCHVI